MKKNKLHMFTVGDGCAKLSLAKRLSIRVLITRVWEPFFMPFCTAVGPCSQLIGKIGGDFNFWSSGPEVDQDDFREGYPKAGDIGARSILRKVVVTLGVSC